MIFTENVTFAGVDNPGHPFIMTVGCVAGDEESYEAFGDLLDPVIDSRHGGYPKVATTVIVHVNTCAIRKKTNKLLSSGKQAQD